MYHVGLDLTPEQVKRLKQVALAHDLPVKAWVTKVVIESMDRQKMPASKKD